jgi:hypothetical protein
MTGMLVYDPTAAGGMETQQLRRAVGALAGKRVGFIDNAKPNFEHLVDELARLLVSDFGVSAIVKRRKRGASIPAPAAMLDEISKECDLVITGSGD